MIGFTGTFFRCRCCHEIAEVPPAQKWFNHADREFRNNWPGDIQLCKSRTEQRS
jgi:hypothetical protein